MNQSSQIRVKAMAIVIRGVDEVLVGFGMDAVKSEEFGRLIGGSVELGETAAVALQREFQEELGSGLERITFLEVVENIFTYEGVQGHEVIFVYQAELAKKELYTQDSFTILDSKDPAGWMSYQKVLRGEMKLYPPLDYGRYLHSN